MKTTPLFIVLLCLHSILIGQESSDRTKIDVRFWDELEHFHSGTVSSPGRFFKNATPAATTDVIIYTHSAADAKNAGVSPISVYPQFYTARVTYEQLEKLSTFSSTVYIEAPKLRYPRLDKSLVDMKVDKLHAGQVNSTVYKGAGVIVGIIDSGIDWKHQDFRLDSDTTKSRILFLRDMTTGLEFTQTQINNELDGTPANVVTEEDFSGHGTHVASAAAGDGSASSGKYTGVAPEADLIIVKAGDESFSTTDIINGITYIRQKAVALGKPFVINMSLGSHDGSHDGTSAEEISVDAELNGTTGRQIVMAAGNEGADAIYGGGTLTQGNNKAFTFEIPAYTPNSGAVNDFVAFSLWYKNGDDFTVAVKTPNNTTVTAATGASQTNASANGFVRVANGMGAVNSLGAKECVIEIYDNSSSQTPTVGTGWTITVTAGAVPQGGTFDMWLSGSSMGAELTSGHSFAKLVGMPGTAEKGITVGAYATKWSWPSVDGNTYGYSGTDRTNNFSTFSSMGPTRDGRQKPDVSAPGQAIGAARSSSVDFSDPVLLTPSGKYVIEQGTSMAAPHVAGLVALMLQAKPAIASAQIRSTLNTTARKDGFTGVSASAQWGNGKVDAEAAVQGILSVERITSVLPIDFVLEQNFPNPFNPVTKIRFALPHNGMSTLTVYSVLGEKVATLVHEHLERGNYAVTFNGEGLASGVYLYTLTTPSITVSKKMLLLR